jgi:pimeloyl-ACP methyl ester carboxylesterase
MRILHTERATGASHSPNLIDRPGQERPRRFVRLAEDLDLAWAEEGAGRAVVLIHGTLTALEDMTLSLCPVLAPGYRVIALDRPGFGHSSARRLVDAGVWRQAASLGAAVDSLGLDRPILVGHSFGASVALAMAIDRPERIGGVVALAPLVLPEVRLEQPLFGPRAAPFVGDLVSHAAGTSSDRALLPLLWRSMFLPQAMPEAVVASFPFALAGRSRCAVRTGEDAVTAPAGLARLTMLAKDCPVPIRIFGGDRDLVVHNGTNGRMLAAVMPNASFTDLPGLGHMIHHFAGETIAAAVDDLAGQAA